jgi:hypothetical protein
LDEPVVVEAGEDIRRKAAVFGAEVSCELGQDVFAKALGGGRLAIERPFLEVGRARRGGGVAGREEDDRAVVARRSGARRAGSRVG